MEYKSGRNRRRLKRFIQKGIFFIIIFYFLSNTVYSFFPNYNKKTTYAEKYTWINSIKTKGIIIKDEFVFQTNNPLEIQMIAREGTRVPVGDRIAESQSETRINTLNNRLNLINESIDILKGVTKPEGYNDYLGEDLDISLSKLTIESLEKEKEELSVEISSGSKSYISTVSGIVSYELDDYEKVLIPKDYENYTFEKVSELFETSEENEDEVEEEKTTKGLKIINNFNWYTAVMIDKDIDISGYKINDYILIQLPDLGQELSGRLITINKTNGGIVLVLEFSKKLHNFYNSRFTNINIVLERKDVYKLPTKTTFNYNDQLGVLSKDFKGDILFRPIIILNEEDEYCIVDKGDEKGYIRSNDSDIEHKTITIYDEIVLNPLKIKSDKILN